MEQMLILMLVPFDTAIILTPSLFQIVGAALLIHIIIMKISINNLVLSD